MRFEFHGRSFVCGFLASGIYFQWDQLDAIGAGLSMAAAGALLVYRLANKEHP
ncbi:hypothetical protein N5C72_07805 [Achromobacter mucicolens]|jgi:hypothetical protein|uniref:Uncharacterized protein n=1 Tax=Achromobacter mucicolens TaxID=1389922 RepID=A0ABD4YRR3_9BURK|nr:hypothetical protein [Achromobacter mucicolens]MDH1177975.1 hypothetical protein [Achromobacter mucicolens]